VQVAYICGTGGCGVRPIWLAAGLGIPLGAWIVVTLARRMTHRRWTRKRPPGGGKRKSGAPAKAKPAGRRKPSARAKA